jgi:carotenoid cleavage dioxygenase-like enzyme
MHDFAATRTMTILLNLPLTLSPSNLFSLWNPQPLIHFDRTLPSEFIVFPRLLGDPTTPQRPVTFTDPESCLIFHTANAWDTPQGDVGMLACRFKSAKLVYAAGAVEVPQVEKEAGKGDVVNLYYYHFALPDGYRSPGILDSPERGQITHAFPLSPIPFEFPTYPSHLSMSKTKFIYGCTMREGSFDERLGGAAKVDCLVKFDVETLIARGQQRTEGLREPVDPRSVMDILADQESGVTQSTLEVFALPLGWYAQEPRFVAREGQGLDEDDGYLMTYGKISVEIS